jgi:hypothetical protein
VDQFFAECTACSWESKPVGDATSAANAGISHLAVTHPAMLEASQVDCIRVWTYQALQMQVVMPHAPATPPPEKHEAKHEPAKKR